MQEKVLDHVEGDDLLVEVVWMPVLERDSREAAEKAMSLIPDARAIHFWDGEQALGRLYAQKVELPAGRNLAWDIYFGFPRGTRWKETAPAPAEWAHQLGSDERHLREGIGLQRFIDELLAEPADE